MAESKAESAEVEQARVRQAVRDLQGDYRDAHLLVKRGRIYDTCSCGWYGSDHPSHVAALSSPPVKETS